MEKTSDIGYTFFMRILWLMLLMAGGLLTTFLLYFAGGFIASGFDANDFSSKMQNMSTNVGMLRWMQAIQSFCVFIVPPFIFCQIHKVHAARFLQMNKPNLSALVIGMLSIPVMSPIINVLVEWNQGLHMPESLQGLETWMRNSEDAAQKVTDIMLSGHSVFDLAVNLLLVAGLAGFGEELLFRGLIQRIVSDGINPHRSGNGYPAWVMHVSIWAVAILFSAVHLQFYGFFARLLLGAWFGYLLWWSGSIWVPVWAHLTNNAISTWVVYYENNWNPTVNLDHYGLGQTWWLCLISALCLAGMAWFLMNRKKQLVQ
jgi:uncharacterized protein